MLPSNRSLALNAICLYIAAYLVTIMIHEMGHAVMSLALGGQPILYNTSVANTNKALSDSARVLIAAAGPVVSLLQGLILLFLVRRSQAASSWALFWLYMGVFGLINFLGYIMIAPVVSGGDTGQIVALLHVPAWAQWSAAVLSLFLLISAISRTGPLFLRLVPTEIQQEPAQKTSAMRALIIWPWLVGSIVLVLLSLPAPHPAIVANMFMSPMVLRRAYSVAMKSPISVVAPSELLRQQWLPLLAVILIGVVFKLLSQGIAW